MMVLILVMLSLIFGGVLVTGVAVWVSTKSSLLRNIVAFCLAGVSAYSIGFVLDMHRLAAAGTIPPSNVVWPTFTWLAIAFACLVAAFQTGGSRYMLAIPFLINAVLALLFASSMDEVIFVATPLCLASVAIFLYRRRKVATHASFLIDRYRLDAPVDELTGLIEFSPTEYAAMGRQFEDEKNYNATPVSLLGHSWNVKLQTVRGQICKIVLHLVFPGKHEANPVAMQMLRYCTDQLGKPAEQKTGLFLWRTTDGNIILETSDSAEGPVIGLFLTSRSIRGFKRL
ncbi:MAG: hypothetical protein ACYDHM_02950 [Acidiferrobacterales bacterium]